MQNVTTSYPISIYIMYPPQTWLASWIITLYHIYLLSIWWIAHLFYFIEFGTEGEKWVWSVQNLIFCSTLLWIDIHIFEMGWPVNQRIKFGHNFLLEILAKGLQTVGHIGCCSGFNSELYNNKNRMVTLYVFEKSSFGFDIKLSIS